MRNVRLNLRTAVLAGTVALALYGSGPHVHGGEREAVPASVASTGGKLIVHEWGTFTSFSGSNGAQLDFHPLLNEDLPEFVYDRTMQAGIPLLTKSRVRSRVRMETPVTYFYTDRERTVRARVDFPSGLLTEFYPPVVSMAPAMDVPTNSRAARRNSHLDWGEIRLIPPAKLASAVEDDAARVWLQSQVERTILPQSGSPQNHYYQARETDSALVLVTHPKPTEPYQPVGTWLEKFLFYRGVGHFDQPLRVEVSDDNRVRVLNPGRQPIRSLFCVTIAEGSVRCATLSSLDATESAAFPELQEITTEDLSNAMVAALVRENLYEKEAWAMVRTWQNSWFTETGTRVFYMVPQETTDKLPPLTVTPTPDETVRVLVGRVDCLNPTQESKLLELVATQARKRDQHRKQNPAHPSAGKIALPEELLKLGRMAEPALVRVRELAADRRVSLEAETLIQELRTSLDAPAEEREPAGSFLRALQPLLGGK